MREVEHSVRAVIFDMDGVLTDTKRPLLKAWQETFDKYRIPIGIDEIKSLVLGVVQYDKLKEVITKKFSFKGNIDALIEEAESYYRSIAPLNIKPVPGLLSFLQKLREKSIEMVVATSASRQTMNVILNALKISSYFKYSFCSDDVTNRKPHPEVFTLAAALLQVKHSECLVVEDAPCGIKAAKSLNMLCIALATTHSGDLLRDSDYIINSFEEFPWELITFIH